MKTLGLLIVSLFLVACETTKQPRPVQVNTDPMIICQKTPDAERIITREVEFHVIKSEKGITYIGLLPKHYENLSLNMRSIIKHIEQKNGIIEYYEDCLVEDNKVDDENQD